MRRSTITALTFQRLQICDHIADLTGIEPKFRHGGAAGKDALSQGLFQGFDRVSLVERSEGRRDADHLDRVALGAMS